MTRLGPEPQVVVRSVSGGGVPVEEVARGLGLRLAGALGDEQDVRAALLAGRPDGLVHGTALAELCRRLLDDTVTARRAA